MGECGYCNQVSAATTNQYSVVDVVWSIVSHHLPSGLRTKILLPLLLVLRLGIARPQQLYRIFRLWTVL